MYKIELKGCLPILLITFFIIFIAFKLWFLIVLIFLFFIFKNTIMEIIHNIRQKQLEKEMSYHPEKGEVYKICPYCGRNVKRSCEKCPNCGNKLD